MKTKHLFFTLIVLSVFAIKQSEASGLSVEELIKLALELALPFIESSLTKLYGSIWGSGRAARSTDIAIFNGSDKNFTLIENGCDSGGWTNSLLPNHLVPGHASVVHGTESHGFMTGATGCRVVYRSSDGATIEMSVSNPFIGDNHAYSRGSGINAAQPVVSVGTNNQVRFNIDPLKGPNLFFIEVYTPKEILM